MLRMGLVALAMAASAAMAAENDDDYKAEAAIRVCANVLRGIRGSVLIMTAAGNRFRPTFNLATKTEQLHHSKSA